MPLNALLVRSPLLVGAAGRMGLLQPARFRVVKRVRKFDGKYRAIVVTSVQNIRCVVDLFGFPFAAGLLRRCYGSSANNTTDQRRVQSDMVNRKILQARFQINACKIPNITHARTPLEKQRLRAREQAAAAASLAASELPMAAATDVCQEICEKVVVVVG